MAVLIEALNVIVKDEAFEGNPLNRDLFFKNIPSKAFCSDGLIHRIGFMDPKYVGQYIEYLEGELGLTFLDYQKKAKDIVVVDMLKGPTTNCDWIVFKRDKFFLERKEFEKFNEDFSIAWKLGNYEGNREDYLMLHTNDNDIETHFSEYGISFPKSWTPDRALYDSNFTPNPKDDLEEISRDDKIITYRKRSTGELVYVGIPII